MMAMLESPPSRLEVPYPVSSIHTRPSEHASCPGLALLVGATLDTPRVAPSISAASTYCTRACMLHAGA